MRISDWSSDVCSSDLVRQVLEGHRIGGDQAGAGTGLDRHVAHGHALLHRQRCNGGAAVLDDMTGAAVDADGADHVQDQVLGGDPGAELAVDGDRKRLRLALQQALRGQHVTRSEEHTSELQSLMRSSYAVFCLKKKKQYYIHVG